MKNIKNFFIFLKKIFFRKKNIKWFALLLICIVAYTFFRFQKKVDEYIVENHDMYQYFTGFRVDYKGTIKLNKDDEKITQITFGDDTVYLDSTPLYFNGEKKALFPEAMSVVKPKEGSQFRINYYTTVYQDLDYYSVLDGKKNTKLVNSVLYDGKDLYFFIENVTVSFGEKSIKLGPLSYIIVDTFNNTVEIYDFENDAGALYENVMEEVIIQNDEYRLNASLDVMYFNGKSRLLIKDISKLKQFS